MSNPTNMSSIIPIICSILGATLGFIFGMRQQFILKKKREQDTAYEEFYVPLFKLMATESFFVIKNNKRNLNNECIEHLIELSFTNIKHMKKESQEKFMTFCSLWRSYINNPSPKNINNLLPYLGDYLKCLLTNAQTISKKVKKSIPVESLSWIINLINLFDNKL